MALSSHSSLAGGGWQRRQRRRSPVKAPVDQAQPSVARCARHASRASAIRGAAARGRGRGSVCALAPVVSPSARGHRRIVARSAGAACSAAPSLTDLAFFTRTAVLRTDRPLTMNRAQQRRLCRDAVATVPRQARIAASTCAPRPSGVPVPWWFALVPSPLAVGCLGLVWCAAHGREWSSPGSSPWPRWPAPCCRRPRIARCMCVCRGRT
eukprot:COSAG01_NODE_3691_length_5790_cov_3.696011_9_plen_210_part_00